MVRPGIPNARPEALPPAEEERGEFSWLWVWLILAVGIGVGVVLTLLSWGRTAADHRDAFHEGWRGAAVLAILAIVVGVSRLRLSQREHRRQLAADGRLGRVIDIALAVAT